MYTYVCVYAICIKPHKNLIFASQLKMKLMSGKVLPNKLRLCYVDNQTAHQSESQGEDAYADELETVMGGLRQHWVNLGDPSMFSDHCSLAKYSRELKGMELGGMKKHIFSNQKPGLLK